MHHNNFQKFSDLTLHGGFHARLHAARLGRLEQSLSLDSSPELLSKSQGLPVLSGLFDSCGGQIDQAQGFVLTWGWLQLSADAPILTLRKQCGPHVMYWLANPCDPAIWTAVERWNAAQHMVICTGLEDTGEAFLATPPFILENGMQGLRERVRWHEQSKRPFLSVASRWLQSGLESVATEDLQDYASFQACILCTENTWLPDWNPSQGATTYTL